MFLCNGETTGNSEQVVSEAQTPNRSRNRSKPVGRINRFLKKGSKLSGGAPDLHGAVVLLEYLAAEVLELAARRQHKKSDDLSQPSSAFAA